MRLVCKNRSRGTGLLEGTGLEEPVLEILSRRAGLKEPICWRNRSGGTGLEEPVCETCL